MWGRTPVSVLRLLVGCRALALLARYSWSLRGRKCSRARYCHLERGVSRLNGSKGCLELWNRRMGHLNADAVPQMLRKGRERGMELSGGSQPTTPLRTLAQRET